MHRSEHITSENWPVWLNGGNQATGDGLTLDRRMLWRRSGLPERPNIANIISSATYCHHYGSPAGHTFSWFNLTSHLDLFLNGVFIQLFLWCDYKSMKLQLEFLVKMLSFPCSWIRGIIVSDWSNYKVVKYSYAVCDIFYCSVIEMQVFSGVTVLAMSIFIQQSIHLLRFACLNVT